MDGKELGRCVPVREDHNDSGKNGQESRYELKALGRCDREHVGVTWAAAWTSSFTTASTHSHYPMRERNPETIGPLS